MNNQDLLEISREKDYQDVIKWIKKQASLYGGVVWENQKKYDWGQALARQAYGEDWAQKGDLDFQAPFVMRIVRNDTFFPWITKVSKSVYWTSSGLMLNGI